MNWRGYSQNPNLNLLEIEQFDFNIFDNLELDYICENICYNSFDKDREDFLKNIF